MKTFKLTIVAALAACGTVNQPEPSSGSGADPAPEAYAGPTPGSGSGSGSTPTHPYNTFYGSILDERGDSIDFTTGEPVHTHAGPSIDLSSGCPDVYKYAYLMDQADPMFGRQTNPNPLAWQIASDSSAIDETKSAYRVRADDGSVLLAWTPIAPDDRGIYTVALQRNGAHPIAALGDHTGVMHLDVRFQDSAGNETVTSACWTHHPMAAPLQIGQLERADLFQMTLPAGSPVSNVVNRFVPATSASLVQDTSEPITISLAGTTPTGTYSRTVVDDYVVGSIAATPASCTTATTYPCDVSPVVSFPSDTSSGALTGMWFSQVIDDQDNFAICDGPAGISSCTIPPRAATEPPHAYHLVMFFGETTDLRAPASMPTSSSYGEFTVQNLTYTGIPPMTDTGVTRCASVRQSPVFGSPITCMSTKVYVRIVALDKARIDLDPISLALTTQPDATAAPMSVPYLANSAIASGALTWDAGDLGLPLD